MNIATSETLKVSLPNRTASGHIWQLKFQLDLKVKTNNFEEKKSNTTYDGRISKKKWKYRGYSNFVKGKDRVEVIL